MVKFKASIGRYIFLNTVKNTTDIKKLVRVTFTGGSSKTSFTVVTGIAKKIKLKINISY